MNIKTVTLVFLIMAAAFFSTGQAWAVGEILKLTAVETASCAGQAPFEQDFTYYGKVETDAELSIYADSALSVKLFHLAARW